MTDGLSTLYQDLLGGSYDCVDRIVLNAYFRMGHDPGGFRVWWRALTGSDETLENAYLMRLAGRFSRRIRGYAKAHDIPVIDCPAGQRKHDLAEEYLAKTRVAQGLFLVLVGRAQAPVWMSARSTTSKERSRCPRPSCFVPEDWRDGARLWQAVSFLKERLLQAQSQLVPVVHRRDPRARAATVTSLAERRAGGPCGPTGASVSASRSRRPSAAIEGSTG